MHQTVEEQHGEMADKVYHGVLSYEADPRNTWYVCCYQEARQAAQDG